MDPTRDGEAPDSLEARRRTITREFFLGGTLGITLVPLAIGPLLGRFGPGVAVVVVMAAFLLAAAVSAGLVADLRRPKRR